MFTKLSLGTLTFMLGISLSTSPTVLAAEPPMFPIGAGGETCGEWLSLRDSTANAATDAVKEMIVLSWVQGFVVVSKRKTRRRLRRARR